MSTQNNQIGLFGFGVVGEGFYNFVKKDKPNRINTVVVKNNKKRTATNINFSTEGDEFLNNEIPSNIVEAINNDNEAFEILARSLQKGKQVVSASKKALALNLEELIQLEKEHNGTLLYEAAVAGSIPIIRILNSFYQQEEISSVKGILNGSSNYILSQLFNSTISYEDALQQAQEKGFAEADPTSDVGGFDALYKLILITLQAYGEIIKPENVLNLGIQHISEKDIEFAKKYDLKIKQIASVQKENNKLTLSVLPTFVDESSELFHVENEYNAVEIISETIGVQLYKGKGAGSYPTGSSVYADLKALDIGYKYSYKNPTQKLSQNTDKQVEFLVHIPENFQQEQLPFKVDYLTQIEENLFLVKSSLANIFENKTAIEEQKLSLLFFDNSTIKSKFQKTIKEISVKELNEIKTNKDVAVFDVRETWEYELTNIGGALVPLAEVDKIASLIDKNKKSVIVCRSGKRSANAIQYLEEKYGFTNLYNLKGGIIAWADEIDSTIQKY